MIELSLALMKGVAQTLGEMLRDKDTAPRIITDFPMVKVSFSKPDGAIFKVLRRRDLPDVAGLKENQEVYIYQEV